MFTNNDNDSERGQVGIGTLIVFIALVLVAAIAAGVLINTAGFLQSQAEATGEESTEQVTNSLSVQTSTAEVDASGDIRTIELEVSLASGSDPVDVTEATLQWVGEDDSATQEIVESDETTDDVDSTHVYVLDENTNELTESGDSTTIFIAASEEDVINGDSGIPNDLPMEEGDNADLTITTSSGGQTFETLRVPEILQNSEGVDL